MFATSTLLRRLVLPLLALGGLLGAIVFWALSSSQSSMLQRELGTQAACIASELESFARAHPVAEDVLLHVGSLDRQVLGVQRVQLVDIGSQKVLAMPESLSAGTATHLMGDLYPLASRRLSLEAGMDDYASKPVKLDLLGKLVARLLG